ncbi:MAG: NAD(P)/FAD-dependent oxidoreductase [Rhizobacter sp.]|nr:NAD(P)/FAD-dependent oxidoreductase [Ferruginibacter sp.]
MTDKNFEVIIIGGSYAGLSAAMALGRSLRKVLIIDSGNPCNKQTPHAHNFITHDGETPAAIILKAKTQLAQYNTVQFHVGLAIEGTRNENDYSITTEAGDTFHGTKLLFATGVTDELPAIPGFAECWGISVLHCPYCHGYEVKDQRMAVIANGDIGFEFCKLISNLTKQLTLLTNGKSLLTEVQIKKIREHDIELIEKEIHSIGHVNGYLNKVTFTDNSIVPLSAIFSRAAFRQHCHLPAKLGCAITDTGYIQIDDFHKTTIPGVFAAGDNITMFRSVATAVAAGNKAGAVINKEFIDDHF